MLHITLPEKEYYDEQSGEFVTFKKQELTLEHSLVSLSRWESKWKKPFLGNEAHSLEETIDYIRCMNVNQGVPPETWKRIDLPTVKRVQDYIADPQTATKIYDRRPEARGHKETITSELIYYWMVANDIPFECQKWPLNRLITLIRICSIKNTPAKKMSKASIYAQNRSLNAARRNALHSRG